LKANSDGAIAGKIEADDTKLADDAKNAEANM